jgi:hypothetical protein
MLITYSGNYGEKYFLNCDAVQSNRNLPTFPKNVGNYFQSTRITSQNRIRYLNMQ